MIILHVQVNQQILDILPSFKIGIIHYTNIIVDESPQMIKGRLQLFQEQLFFELDEKPLSAFTGVHEWRTTWKALGGNPSRHRPSNEALLRRIKKQQYLSPVNSAVDLNNFFSLQYDIPIGIYDCAAIHDTLTVILGEQDTAYEGLNGRLNSLTNILTLTDKEGPFGSPYVDSKRTAVTEQTTDAIQFLFLQASMSVDEAHQLMKAAGNMFSSIHAGQFDYAILDRHQPSTTI